MSRLTLPTPGPWMMEPLRDGFFPTIRVRPATLAGKLTYSDGSWSKSAEEGIGTLCINTGLDAQALQQGFALNTMATCIANARLITAAPDLRDAVQAALDEFAVGSFNAARRQRVVEFIRIALARSEGR